MGFEQEREKKDCDVVPQLLPGAEAVQDREECGDSLSREIFNSMKNKDVKVLNTSPNNETHGGSGFFINQGDEIITDAHVVANSKSVEVITTDGAHYQAQIVDVDSAQDLARLKIVGIDKDPSRAVERNESLAAIDKDALAYTVAAADRQKANTFLSVGEIKSLITMNQAYQGTDPSAGDYVYYAARNEAGVEKEDARAYLSGTRLLTSQQVLPGESGAMMVGSNGKLMGVITSSINAQRSLATPVDKVNEFLASKPRYEFHYDRFSRFDNNFSGTLAENGLVAGSLLPKLNKIAPAFYGAYKATQLPEDLRNYQAIQGESKGEAGRTVLEDLAFVGGALANTIGLIPRLRPLKTVGMALYASAGVSSFIGDVEKKELGLTDIKRVDGSGGRDKPFLWDVREDGQPIK